jgi:hypothetical protein
MIVLAGLFCELCVLNILKLVIQVGTQIMCLIFKGQVVSDPLFCILKIRWPREHEWSSLNSMNYENSIA